MSNVFSSYHLQPISDPSLVPSEKSCSNSASNQSAEIVGQATEHTLKAQRNLNELNLMKINSDSSRKSATYQRN